MTDTDRVAAGHARPADPQGRLARAAARLRRAAAHPADLAATGCRSSRARSIPALYRLEHQGLIASEWGESENKRQREVLHAHRRRPPAAQGGDRVLEAAVRGDRHSRSRRCRRTYEHARAAASWFRAAPARRLRARDAATSCGPTSSCYEADLRRQRRAGRRSPPAGAAPSSAASSAQGRMPRGASACGCSTSCAATSATPCGCCAGRPRSRWWRCCRSGSASAPTPRSSA